MSSEYLRREKELKEALATASEGTVRLIETQQYETATGNIKRFKGFPCTITATGEDGTDVATLEVASFAAACRLGLLYPRFVTEHQRNQVWPRTFTARDHGQNKSASAEAAPLIV